MGGNLMMNNPIKYFKWGDCKSENESKPDLLTIRLMDSGLIESEFSLNSFGEVSLNDSEFIEMIIPIQNLSSNNRQLFTLWDKLRKEEFIQVGNKIKIKTWLGISKNNRSIRRFRVNRGRK